MLGFAELKGEWLGTGLNMAENAGTRFRTRLKMLEYSAPIV